jgi:hypothetical protein
VLETGTVLTLTTEPHDMYIGRVSHHAHEDDWNYPRRPYIDDFGIDLGHRAPGFLRLEP